MPLLSLPSELILATASFLRFADVASLCSVNKSLNLIVGSFLFHEDVRQYDGSALIWAAAVGQLGTAQKSLDAGADIDSRITNSSSSDLATDHSSYGNIADDEMESRSSLTEAQVGVKARRPAGAVFVLAKNTRPLLLAITNRNHEMRQFLLENGANPNWIEDDLLSPLAEACRANEMSDITSLIAFGADPLRTNPMNGKSCLHYAAENQKSDILNFLLYSPSLREEAMAYLNVQDDAGRTPLMEALDKSNSDAVELLLQTGQADLFQRDSDGMVPLRLASRNSKLFLMILYADNFSVEKQDALTLRTLGMSLTWKVSELKFHALLEAGFDPDLVAAGSSLSLLKQASSSLPRCVEYLLYSDWISRESKLADKAYVMEELEREEDLDIEVDEIEAIFSCLEQDTPYPYKLEYAARLNIMPMVKQFLAEPQVDINAETTHNKTTPICSAIESNNWEIVALLLRHGADVNRCSRKHLYPIHLACQQLSVHSDAPLKVVRNLLESGSHLEAPDREGYTPLQRASRDGNIDCIELLLRYGAAWPENPEVALLSYLLRGHIDLQYVAFVLEKLSPKQLDKILHRNDSEAWESTVSPEGTALHIACMWAREDLVEMLLDRGANTEVRDSKERTPMHIASAGKKSSLVRRLLAYGADPNACDRNGHTPLSRAGVHRHVHICKLLVLYGANPSFLRPFLLINNCSLGGKYAFERVRWLLSVGMDPNKDAPGLLFCPLHAAVNRPGSGRVVRLLLESGANPNVLSPNDLTPLHLTGCLESADNVRLLLKHGANPLAIAPDNLTPIHKAASHGTPEVFRLLLAPIIIPFEQIISTKSSVLQSALENDWYHREMFEILLDYGVDPNDVVELEQGFNVLHQAIWWEDILLVQILLKSGKMNINAVDLSGKTALDHAKEYEFADIQSLLEEVLQT